MEIIAAEVLWKFSETENTLDEGSSSHQDAAMLPAKSARQLTRRLLDTVNRSIPLPAMEESEITFRIHIIYILFAR